MDKQNSSDIAAFPELFDGMEQFIEEQANELKRTGALVALLLAVPVTLSMAYALNKLF